MSLILPSLSVDYLVDSAQKLRITSEKISLAILKKSTLTYTKCQFNGIPVVPIWIFNHKDQLISNNFQSMYSNLSDICLPFCVHQVNYLIISICMYTDSLGLTVNFNFNMESGRPLFSKKALACEELMIVPHQLNAHIGM